MKPTKKEILMDEVDYYIRHGLDEKNPYHKKFIKEESDENFVLWIIDEIL